MQKLRDHLFRTYFIIDPRSLGLFRIAYGITLLTDLWLRYCALDTFYTNKGLLPNHTLLWAPPNQRMISLFFTTSSHGQSLLLMTVCALVFVQYLVGFKTKLAQVLTLICLFSVNTRLASLENGGDMVMNLLGIWSLVLPVGRRFSIDALLDSMKKHHESSAAELARRDSFAPDATGYTSLAVFALIVQFTAVYYFNVVSKNGSTWLDGSAVHYTLHQDRLVKWVGVWMRESLPFPALKALAYSAIVIETTGCVSIASPFGLKYTRAIAVLLMPMLHLGFELCLDLGVFSFAMMSFFPLLLLPVHWDAMARGFAKLHRRRLVFFDASCGVCLWCARALARMDRLGRLELLENTDTARLPQGIAPELLDATILVVDPESGRTYTRAAAFAQIFRALPFGFLLALPLQLPGLAQLANVVYDQVAKSRTRISTFFGMTACGVPIAASLVHQDDAPTSDAQAFWKRNLRRFGEVYVAWMMLCVGGEVINNNNAVPRFMRYRQPEVMYAFVEYPRLYQGWRMFAPQAPMEDFTIEIDATTIDGRHVDPYNEVASRVHGPGQKEIAPALHQNQFFTAYSLFIWRDGFRAYRTAFQEWILRYHERTGNPRDRIVRYTVYKLSDKSPPPGKTKNTDFKREAFMRYPGPI